jgi:peptide-methionine (S)-S-oxide reductase
MTDVALRHAVNGRPLEGPWPAGSEVVLFGMGCFWGAERRFWEQPGVWVTAVGYAGGQVAHPTYEQVCTGRTGHAEVVRVVFEPSAVTFEDLLAVFWEGHDPTQGMRQGNDVGPQYRSLLGWTTEAQRVAAEASREVYGEALRQAGYRPITTEVVAAPRFWPAEEYHQQYLAKHPWGYCGLGGTGVPYPSAARQ